MCFSVTFVGFSFSHRGAPTIWSACDWKVCPGKSQLSVELCVHSVCPRVGVGVGVRVGTISSPSSGPMGTPARLPVLGPSLTFSNPNIWWWKHQTRTKHVSTSLGCHGARLFIPLIWQLFMRLQHLRMKLIVWRMWGRRTWCGAPEREKLIMKTGNEWMDQMEQFKQDPLLGGLFKSAGEELCPTGVGYQRRFRCKEVGLLKGWNFSNWTNCQYFHTCVN